MNSATAFFFGFGTCLLLWIAAEVSWPRRRELEPPPEEENRLDRKSILGVSGSPGPPGFVSQAPSNCGSIWSGHAGRKRISKKSVTKAATVRD